MHNDDITHVTLDTRPPSFLRATLKTWEWPGDEATLGREKMIKSGRGRKICRALCAQLHLQPHHTKNPRSAPATANHCSSCANQPFTNRVGCLFSSSSENAELA